MDEVMTWAEIEDAFDGEWVLIEDTELTSSPEILGGKVIFHSKSRAEIHEKVMELSRLNHAVLFIGKTSINFLINWGLPGGYGIFDWSELDLYQTGSQEHNPDEIRQSV